MSDPTEARVWGPWVFLLVVFVLALGAVAIALDLVFGRSVKRTTDALSQKQLQKYRDDEPVDALVIRQLRGRK